MIDDLELDHRVERCDHDGTACLRLLITDPFHPVSAATLVALRRTCARAVVSAVAPDTANRLAPPGIDRVYAVPDPGEPEFAEAVRDAAIAAGADVVLPWSDRDALALATNRDVLTSAGLAVVCPPRVLVELACDKWATLRRLVDLGVPAPDSRLVCSGDELYSAAAVLGYPATSLVVKPRGLAGGQGVWMIREDADPARTNPRPQVPLAAMAVMLDAGLPHDTAGFVVQPELHGSDVSVDVLARDGALLASVVRTREATLGGLSVQGSAGPLDVTLAPTIERLVAGLGWSSLANVQLVVGAAGPVVYEINARASGSIGVAALGGLDLLWCAIRQARGDRLPSRTHVHTPLRFRRYWADQWWPTASGRGQAVTVIDAAAVVVAESVPPAARSVLVLDLAANESGSHKLRAAVGIVAAAVRDGHRRVAAGSCGNYGVAVAIAARDAGIDATVTLPAGWGDEGAAIRSLGARVELVDGGYEDAVAASKRSAARDGTADANVDGPYAASGMLALSSIIDDLADVVAQPPAVMWVPLGNGTTLAALHAGIARRGWATALVGISSTGNSSILASWPGTAHALLDPVTLRETEVNEPLVNWAALHGDEALAALHATRGAAIGVSDMTLLAGRDVLAAIGVAATPAGAAGVAGLMTAAGGHASWPGVHVALVTGRPWQARP